MLRFSLILIVGLVFFGCSGESERTTSLVRDSAGIRIIENLEGTWGDPGPTQIARGRILEVSTSEEDGDDPLYRVGHVRWIDSDRFVLANSGTELRIYDLDGDILRRFGGEGEGPGEFRRIVGISPLEGGNLAISDSRLRRITYLDSLGTAWRTVQIEGPLPPSPELIDGVWLAGLVPGERRADGPRLDRILDSLIAINLETMAREVWAEVPGDRVLWRPLPNGLPAIISMSLTPEAVSESRYGRTVLGSSDRFELRELDNQGDLVRIVRKLTPARPTAESDKTTFLQLWEEHGRPPYAEPEFADSIPHFRDIFLDDRGRTWVQLYQVRGQPTPGWELFAEDGVYLGRVELPDRFVPHDVLDGRMIGVWRDSLDVEYVQAWTLAFPGAAER